jgi:hypothetical protein
LFDLLREAREDIDPGELLKPSQRDHLKVTPGTVLHKVGRAHLLLRVVNSFEDVSWH